MDELTMGQRIAQERKRLGISQEALGEKMGVSRQAISKWEADGAVPEIDKLISLSKLFGTSVGWLLGVETPSQTQPDELTESQLKMVEEIVKRYQPATQKPKQPWYISVLLCIIAITGILSIMVMTIMSYAPSASIPDYSRQIADLQRQLSSLDSRLDEITHAAENYDKLLTNYGFELTAVQDNARVTFNGIPKNYHETQTAVLRVSRDNGEVFHQYSCSWDGLNWKADLELPIEDGYEFGFLVTEQGKTQIQLLDGNHFESLADSLEIQCEISNPIEVRRDLGELRVDQLGAQAHMPALVAESRDLFWTDLSFILYVDGVETDRYTLLDRDGMNPYQSDQSSFSFSSGGGLMEVPNLYDGMQITVTFYAALSNGLDKEVPAGYWVIQDGEPVVK